MSDFKRIRDNVQKMVDQSAPEYDIDGYLESEGFTPREFKLANENFGTFMSAVKRGGKNVGSLVADWIPIMGATALEKIAPDSWKSSIQGYKDRQMKEAISTQEEIAKKLPAEYESYKEVEGIGDALGYAKETLGESLASFLPGIFTGGVGSVMSRGAVAKAGQVAGEAARKGTLGAAKEAAERGVPGAAEEFVSGVAEQRAKTAGIEAAKKAMTRTELGRDVANTFIGSAAINVPDAYQSIYSETGQEALLPAFAAGSFNALLDSFTPVSVLRAAKGKGITGEAIMGAWYKRAAAGLGKGALTEGATEGLQEITNAAAEAFVAEHDNIFTPENLTRFIDSAIRGAIAGGGVQAATGVAFGKQAPPAAPPLPPTQPLQPPLGTPAPLPEGISGPPPVTPIEVEGVPGEAGPGLQPIRDLAGVRPEGALPEAREPIIDPETGRITGYREAYVPPGPPELEGEQLEIPFPGQQQELFPGKLPEEQPAPTPIPEAAVPEPINLPEILDSTVKEAKKDPTASKILKGNNPASTKGLTERLAEFLKVANDDPVSAMEQLYTANQEGRLPQGMKALSEAQQELLETVYKRTTGTDINTAIEGRKFQGAEQAGLFEEAAPPAAPAPRPPAAPMDPQAAWERHKNDDHPALSDLNEEERGLWFDFVKRGQGNAVNFQDLVNQYNQRIISETKRTPEQIEKIFGEEKKVTEANIENDIKALDYDGLLNYALNNGPPAMRELMKGVKDAVERMKKRGYKFTFTLSNSPAMSRALELERYAAGHVYPKGNLMELVISGSGSGRPFGANYEVVMHELLHSVTIPLIRYGEMNPNSNEGRIVKEIEALRDHVKKDLMRKRRQGTIKDYELQFLTGTNAFGSKSRRTGKIIHKADEFVSWSMTNSDFRRVLEGIEYQGKSAFSSFVDMIRRLIGLSPKAQTSLAEIIGLTEQLIASQTSVAPSPTFNQPVGQEVASGFGYHSGDLGYGTDTTLGRMTGGRSTGHFGTGVYFVSNPEYYSDLMGYENRPVEKVDLSGYNLLRPRFDYEAEILHKALGKVNSLANNDEINLNSVEAQRAIRDAAYNIYLATGMEKSEAEVSKAIVAAVKEARKLLPKYAFTRDYIDSASTRVVKKLGYEGIDVRHIPKYDNTTYGTVVYTNRFTPKVEEGPLSAISAAPTGNLVGTAPPKQTTKLQPSPTPLQPIKDAAQNAQNAFAGDWWTKWRVGWVDVGAGLSRRLKDLPVFDKDGKLRADMLVRAASQTINLIKTGLQSGVPVLNADGTITIQRSENNISRSQQIADSLDDNAIVKASGLSGRGFVATIARALRGKEIQEIDARRRAKAEQELGQAAVKLRSAYNQFKDGNISKTTLEKIRGQVKEVQKRYKPDLKLNREKQINDKDIAWAEANLAAVPEVQQVLDIWRANHDSLINLWEQTGLLDKDYANNLRAQRFYVPLYAAREDLMAEEQEGYTGRAAGAKTVAEIEKLEGSDLVRNLWENMDKHYAFMTAKAYNNHTRKMAVEQLMSFGINGAKFTKSDDPKVNLRYRDYNNPEADKNGIVSVIVENPLDVAAFQIMPYEMGALMKGISMSTEVLRAGALINPMYWIRQLIRDPLHASIAGQLDTIVTPFHAMKEYIQILANNSAEAELLAQRGVIGQIDSTTTLQQYLKQVGTEKIKPSQISKWSKKIMRMHEASDAATRVAIFKKEKQFALDQGMNEEMATNYAVHKARESINFAVRGNSATLNTLRHMIPFFSAALTSLDTLYRVASGYGLNDQEKAQARQIFVKRAAMMVLLSTAYAMMMQDDEDYQKLPDDVKDNNWLLPSPIGSEHTFIKIPIPFEIGFLFKTLPEGAVRYMSDTSTGKEVLASYRKGFMRSMPGEGVLIPQAFKPGLETVFNFSLFTGRPIEGMSDQGLPVEMRGPNASEVSKMMSRFGLSEIGLSPAKIDYLIKGYTAELGTFTTGVASTMMTELSGKEPPAKNIENQPFFRAFLTDPNTSKAATDFYDIMQNSQEAVNAVNRLKKEGRVEELQEFVSDEDRKKLIAVAPSLRRIQEQMARIRSRINQIKVDYDRDPEDRRDEINKLQGMYDKVARQGYQVLEAAGIER